MALWQPRMSATLHSVLSSLFIHQLGRTQLINIDGALALLPHCRVQASVLLAPSRDVCSRLKGVWFIGAC